MQTRVRELRQARGWTQIDLAERAGVRQATVSKVESRPEKVEVETYIKLAAAFAVDLADLFEGPTQDAQLRRMLANFLRLPIEDRLSLTRQMEALADRVADTPEA